MASAISPHLSRKENLDEWGVFGNIPSLYSWYIIIVLTVYCQLSDGRVLFCVTLGCKNPSGGRFIYIVREFYPDHEEDGTG